MTDSILVVEDDEPLGTQVVGHLREAGYAPVWWRTGRLIGTDDAQQVELVILDLMLPGLYGLDILKALRDHSDVPVLVLSARIDATDKTRALQLGADDYLTKPFWPGELVERVRARLRRPILRREGPLEVGALRIDPANHSVVLRGRPLEVTPLEFKILSELAKRPAEAVTRHWLVKHVLDPERAGGERTLDVHISRLRKKLGSAELIETVWGVGYRLVAKS